MVGFDGLLYWVFWLRMSCFRVSKHWWYGSYGFIWGFPEIGVPPNHSICFSINYKPPIVGYLPLWKPPFNRLLCKITMFKMRFSSSHQAKWAMAFIAVFVRIPAGKSHFMSMQGISPLPSGKHTKNNGKSPLLMGKSTISMAIFNSKLFVYQRVDLIKSHESLNPLKWLIHRTV